MQTEKKIKKRKRYFISRKKERIRQSKVIFFVFFRKCVIMYLMIARKIFSYLFIFPKVNKRQIFFLSRRRYLLTYNKFNLLKIFLKFQK